MNLHHNRTALSFKATLKPSKWFQKKFKQHGLEEIPERTFDVSFNSMEAVLTSKKFQDNNREKFDYIAVALEHPDKRVIFMYLFTLYDANRFIHYYWVMNEDRLHNQSFVVQVEFDRYRKAKTFNIIFFNKLDRQVDEIRFHLCGTELGLSEYINMIDESPFKSYEFFARTPEEIKHDIEYYKLTKY